MLYLIGLGLEKEDISLKALAAIKKCKKIYLETYTTKLPYKKAELEKIIKKKTIEADREIVENKMPELLAEAKKQDVALLIYGDPLAATTHITFMIEAKKQKIKTQIMHAPSILTAASETGLQLYKFGKTASMPAWKPNYTPSSFIEIIKENLSINAHTLLLIDIGLKIEDALNQLKESSGEALMDNMIIIASKLGTSKQKITKGKLKDLLSIKSKLKIDEPYCMIIPSSLHFTEAEFLESL
jgi:diphthine synthase